MQTEFRCPIEGIEYDVYDAYRECPYFHERVSVLARRHGEDPMHIISTGKWQEPVDDELLGLTDA